MDRRARPMPPLPHGHTLVVRPAVSRDVDALEALYERMDDATRLQRFFSPYRPRRSFFDRLVAIGDRGGTCLVAEVRDVHDPDHGEVVAEASFEHAADGDGEWSVVVGSGWPRWIAAALLDALLAAAAERGVANLAADIAASDASLLEVVRARPHTSTPGPDASTFRIRLGTDGAVPTWPAASGRRPRVLIEGSVGWPGTGSAGAVDREDADVQRCPGPGPAHECPVLNGSPCPLAESADAIVMRPAVASEEWSALLAAHAVCHPGATVDLRST